MLDLKKVLTISISMVFLLYFSLFKNNMGVFFIFVLIKYSGEIFYLLIFVFIFIGYRWSAKQKNKKIFRNKLYVILISWTAIILILTYVFSTKYTDCSKYTENLKGGIQEFNKKKYTIKLCGANSFYNSQKIRMEVFDDQGIILALRYFTVDFNFAYTKELKYGASTIFYEDYSKEDPLSTLHMPPTRIDWIRARLPFFNGR